MWHSINKPLGFLRCLLTEYHKLTTLRSFASVTAYNLSITSKAEPKTSTPSVNASSSLKLITAYSGFSKDIAFNRKESLTSINKKKNLIFGDDSLFTSSQECADIMAVADGVGGWRELGVDPSKFSSSLMQQCKRLVEQQTVTFSNCENITSQTPLEILIDGYNALLENKDPGLVGSSTACIIVFNRESRYLYSANLGDSGFAVVRNNQIVHRSQEQYHYFNAPYQVAILPNLSDGDSCFNDKPQSAAVSSFELAEGDFIVMATDGLWDNLSDGALLLQISLIKSYSLQDLETAAKSISRQAVELSKDPNYESPFSVSARKHGMRFIGGKPDDITVLLARVSRVD